MVFLIDFERDFAVPAMGYAQARTPLFPTRFKAIPAWGKNTTKSVPESVPDMKMPP